MKSLLKLTAILASIFLSTFVIVKSTGLLSLDQLNLWFEQASQMRSVYLVLLVVGLLWLDLFIAVPTLTVLLLSGYFLGHTLGFVAGISGLLIAGFCGYGISLKIGGDLLDKLIKDKQKINETTNSFKQHGFVMIVLSRALPVLPEVSACLAGITKMPSSQFIFAWCLSSIPYAYIATYAGSISSLNNPKPAIFAALGLSGCLWLAWYGFKRYKYA